MATKFNVIINPFKQRMCVYARVNKVDCETIIPYSELDEWNSFEFNGRLFDLHLLYDEDIEISIYELQDGGILEGYNNSCPVKLTIRTKDEF
jgi:hypothetical protein